MSVVHRRGKYLYEVGPGRAGVDGKPSVGATYRNASAQNGFATLAGASSLYDVFQQSVKEFPDRECLGWREAGAGPFLWDTYKTVAEKVAAIASAMAHVGIGAHGRAGIYSVNSPEWMTVMQACNRMTIYTVPLYDTLGEGAVTYIVNHSETSIVFVSTVNWAKLAKSLPSLKERVRTVVYWGPDAVDAKAAVSLGINVYSFSEFLELGRKHPAEPIPPQADDLCTIMFTSGTTGTPKGVMISHSMVMTCVAAQKSFVAQVPGVMPVDRDDVFLSYLPLAHIMGVQLTHHSIVSSIAALEAFVRLKPNLAPPSHKDVFFSYLPLAHSFDRVAEELLLHVGGKIGYFSGDVKKLVDDIGTLRPTIFIGVPRVYDRIYAGVMEQITKAGGIKKMLFDLGFKRKLKYLNKGFQHDKASPFFDKLVFSKIKARLGGRVRIALSGAAPLAPHVEDFLRVTMCCFFGQGYGLTESCAASFIATGEVDQVSSVGIALPSHEVRLESIPEMKYDAMAEPPRGEVCIRGPIIFKGYYKEEKMTAEVLDNDGWFHTGDVGEILPSGALKIIDRKKQIFKLSQGEYVAVEKVEAAYKKQPLIAQIFVYGNSLENVLVAVVIPEEAPFLEAAKKEGLSGSFEELVKTPKAKEMLLSKMNVTGKEAGLKGFEMVRGLILDDELFSVDNNLLTPTFKAKRPQLQAKYQSEIDALYAELRKRN